VIAVASLLAMFAPGAVALRQGDEPLRRSLRWLAVAWSWSWILVSGLALYRATAARGVTDGVLLAGGLLIFAVVIALWVDRVLLEANGLVGDGSTHRPVVLRACVVGVFAGSCTVLSLYHAGSLTKIDSITVEFLRAVAPTRLAPPYFLGTAEKNSCTVGDAEPTFDVDHLVACTLPHEWQVLDRRDLSLPCPTADKVRADADVEIVTHDAPYDRWCLAHAIAEPLKTFACLSELPCTV
jgi:hypothetical protein